jgi:hypothetical protein
VSAAPTDVAGQAAPAARKPAAGGVPLMPDGKPDLQGTYDIGTLTPLQRRKVTERFTRVDANTLRYQFTVDDPKTWTKPWTAEYTWLRHAMMS